MDRARSWYLKQITNVNDKLERVSKWDIPHSVSTWKHVIMSMYEILLGLYLWFIVSLSDIIWLPLVREIDFRTHDKNKSCIACLKKNAVFLHMCKKYILIFSSSCFCLQDGNMPFLHPMKKIVFFWKVQDLFLCNIYITF